MIEEANFIILITRCLFSEKVFTFLSADEVEKLKQEEEKKMASLSRAELGSWSPGEDRSGDSERSDDEPCENGHRYHPHLHCTLCVIGAYVNVNLYTSQNSQTISVFSTLKSLKNLV